MLFSEILAIDAPIIQAPMAGVQNWELAVAVSNAGSLGSIPCGMLNVQQIESEIINFQKNSDKPYNLNFFCHEMPNVNDEKLQHWQQYLGEFYRQYDVTPPSDNGALRLPFNQQIADVLQRYKPAVISFHFGLPSAELVQQIKSWGTTILSSATTLEEGRWLCDHGADVVIAQGREAGGHRGMFLTSDLSSQVTTRALVSSLVKHLSVPIIAAGGIADANDIASIMSLGASGVQIGTSYLLCDETKTSHVHRAALTSKLAKTAITNVYSGRPARGITNKLMEQLGFISEHAPAFPYASIAIGPLRAKTESLNLPDCSPLWSGENRSGCREISAALLTQQLRSAFAQ